MRTVGLPVLGLVLGLVGEGRRRDHDGDQDDVAGTKHGMLPLSRKPDFGKLRKAEDREIGGARPAPSVRIAARSLAERARGLAAISASVGATAPPRLVEGRGPRLRLRQVARAGRIAGAVGDEALDDAVLERMEGDHGQPAAGLQHALGRKQRPRQLAELVVDEDAQRLEDARRRMDLVARLAADMRLDRVGKVERALERPARRGASRSCGRCARHGALRRAGRRCASRSPALKRLTTSAALAPACAMRMSSGPSARKEKPRSASSICIEETPMSSTTPSASVGMLRRDARTAPAPASAVRPHAASSARPASIASGSRSIAMTEAPAASSALV